MNRRGVALIAVLWVVTALASLAGVTLALVRTGARTTRNRALLARAGWAREACAEILLARYTVERGLVPLDTTELGRGTWCLAGIADPTASVNVNFASSDALLHILRRSELVDAVLDWRDADDMPRPSGAEAEWYRERGRALPRNGPIVDLRELGLVRGFDDSVLARVSPKLTVEGDGRINPAIAPAEVIATLPGIDGMAAEAFARLDAGARPRSIDGWLAMAPESSRRSMLGEYRALMSATTFAPGALIATAEGGVRGTPIVAVLRLTLVPVAERVAVIRREAM